MDPFIMTKYHLRYPVKIRWKEGRKADPKEGMRRTMSQHLARCLTDPALVGFESAGEPCPDLPKINISIKIHAY
jgi:hypothetical protein